MRNYLKFALTNTLLLVFFVSCTKLEIQKSRYVEADFDAPTKQKNVVEVFATSTLAGNLNKQQALFSDSKPSPVSYGGAPLLLAYREVSKLKTEVKSLWLDTGGSFDSLAGIIHHKQTSHFLNRMNFDALAFTEKELSSVGTNTDLLEAPYVISNLIDLNQAKSFENSSIKNWRIVEKGNFKIGIMAVTGYKNVRKDSPDKAKGLFFEDTVLGVLRVKKHFTNQNVDFTILLANVDSACHSNNENSDQLVCPNEGDELKKLLSRIPPNTINLTIASPNRVAAGVVNNIPVIMSPGLGGWLSRARIEFDQTDSKQQPVVTLLAPLRVCDKIFHSTNDCHIPFEGEATQRIRTELLKESKNELKPAKFWGHEIVEQTQIEEEFQAIRTQGSPSPQSSEF
ncbi:MAG: hypothetical protein CME71_10015 [Halobacteriovorax sp.]|nr:hypothetical protein [Halobacteriovorax sp.]